MDNSLLTVNKLSIGFPSDAGEEFVAVNDLSFTLNKGESLGIVGESGSGKSMTAFAIMRLLPKSAKSNGQILWKDEVDLTSLLENEMQQRRGCKIGMIFQEPLSSLNPVFTCGEQVAEVLKTHLGLNKKDARGKSEEWFRKVKLVDPARIYDAYPHQISGGQRQRVMIAMALCAKPDLLICDEPTTALDVTIQFAILDLLVQLRKEIGVSLIFISHDLAVIKRIADKVLILNKGIKIEHENVNDIFSQPKEKYTQGLLFCRPFIDKRLHRLPVLTDFSGKTKEECLAFITSLEEPSSDYDQRQTFVQNQKVILEIENLSVKFVKERNWYGKPKAFVNAVNQVTLDLRRGESLGLVGESGSGKTTLGKAILRLVNAKTGAIRFKGQEILSLEEDAMRKLRPKMQMVFQDPLNSLNPKMKIGEMLIEPLLVHFNELNKEEKKARIESIIKKVGLSVDSLKRYPHEFSGGQRQRIGLARALLLRPEVLICDESVSALDVSVQAQVLNLIKDLKDEFQFSLIFITHDLSVVKFIADTICVMKAGEIVEKGATEMIFENPKNPYTQKLLSSILK